MFLKPAKEGLIVRHPETKRPLKKEGEKVNKNSYWLRRLKEGSVIEIKGVEKSAPKQQEKKEGGKK